MKRKTMGIISEKEEGFIYKIRIRIYNDGRVTGQTTFIIDSFSFCSSCGAIIEHRAKTCHKCQKMECTELHKQHICDSWTLERRKEQSERRSGSGNPVWKGGLNEAYKRKKAKRRELEFTRLNEPFERCAAHHIDKTHVINIPRRMHETHPHNIWTGEGMFEINMLAFDFLGRQI